MPFRILSFWEWTKFPLNSGGADQMADAPQILIEAHCRRCGSHLGHILNVQGDILHCINGTALTFTPTV